MRWHLRLFDAYGDLLAVVDDLIAPAYQRRIAQASPVSFSLAPASAKTEYVALARAWALYRGNENVASGRITSRDLSADPWSYQGLTNETNLEHLRLPDQWGEGYRGWDIADVGRDLLRSRKTFRLNTQALWQQYLVASTNLDLTTDPGKVMIARASDAEGLHYHASASMTLAFAAPAGGAVWERVRWSEIVGDVTRVKIQYSTDGGATWSDELEAVDAEDVQQNEAVGVLLSGAAGAIQVKFNLYTDDTTSPFYDDEFLTDNPDTTQVFGRTPILAGAEFMTYVAGAVQPHDSEYPAVAGVTLSEPQDWSGATALKAWQDLHDLTGWEWYVDGDNRLHLAESLGADKTGEVVLRAGTNVNLRGLSDSDDDIVNVVTARGAGEGYAQLESIYRHEQSITDHDGVEYAKVVDFPEVTGQAALDAKAQAYANDNAYSKPPLEAELIFPEGDEPSLFLGDTVLAVHPASRTKVSARIVDIRRQLNDSSETWQLGLNAQWGSGGLVDLLTRRTKASEDGAVAPPSAFSAVGGTQAILLRWQGSGTFQIQHTASFDVGEAPINWSDLVVNLSANEYRHAKLTLGSKHAYRIRRVEGTRASGWVGPVVALARASTAPTAPIGLVGTFSGRHAIFTWTQSNDPDYLNTKCEVWIEGVLKRTEYVAGSAFSYTWDMNVADNGTPPSPDVTLRIYHGNLSQVYGDPAEETATNAAPPAPTGLSVSSSLAQLIVDMNDPGIGDLASVEVELATQADYSDASLVYQGTSFQGITAPAGTTGTNYVRARFKDAFGQYSAAYAMANTDAVLVGRADMQGAIFEISPSATLEPTSGELADLWDMNTSTGPAFDGAVTVTFEFPMTWLFDMVRFYPSAAVDYYVQAFDEDSATWVDVAGAAGAQLTATAGAWNVKRFTKMVAARKLRIVCDSALTLYELKFWTITLADEILAQVLTLTAAMYLISEDGALTIDKTGITGKDGDGNVMIHLDLPAGSGFYKGSIQAGELILPTGAI